MQLVKFDGSHGDLGRFAQSVLKRSVMIESLSPFERRMSWNSAGRSGFSSSNTLRSGIALTATKLRWEQPSSMVIDHTASPLKFVLSRGNGPRMTPSSGAAYLLGKGQLQLLQISRTVRTRCEFGEGSGELEHLSLQIDHERLGELLGTQTLPRPVERILTDTGAQAMHSQPMAPALFCLLDEILYCDARGCSRQLYLEAKGLELMALMLDQLEEAEHATSPVLCQRDIDRLEQARRILLNRMDAPPTLPQLARAVGLNEAKLKSGFRSLFGTSVYAYLRHQRMHEAHRLLRKRDLNVSEVALRVGYSNPSKFAAAFRRQFGVPPSSLL